MTEEQKQSNNVIVFPKSSINLNDDELTIDSIKNNIETMKLYHIQEVLNTLTPMIFTQLEIGGFDLENENISTKDGAFMIESIRALLCKHYAIYHPFQRIVEATLTDDPENTEMFKVADEISINLLEEIKKA